MGWGIGFLPPPHPHRFRAGFVIQAEAQIKICQGTETARGQDHEGEDVTQIQSASDEALKLASGLLDDEYAPNNLTNGERDWLIHNIARLLDNFARRPEYAKMYPIPDDQLRIWGDADCIERIAAALYEDMYNCSWARLEEWAKPQWRKMAKTASDAARAPEAAYDGNIDIQDVCPGWPDQR